MAFSLQDNQVIVNYHYVEDPRDSARGIHPCATAEFERQIAFLGAHYRCVSVPQIFEAAHKGSQEKLCAITFDDGLRDQWEYALPLMKKYGVAATFFIITATLEGIMPSAHKIHLISSRISMSELAEQFNLFVSHISPEAATSYHIPSDRYLNHKRRHDAMASANVKEMLNNSAPGEVSGAFLSALFKELGMSEEEECKKLFMNADEIRALQDQGFFAETHTHHHYSLEMETSEALDKDFHAAITALTHILGKSPTVMAYPYGRPPADHAILAACGITLGVTAENRALHAGDHPLLIPRFDTNDLKNFLDISPS